MNPKFFLRGFLGTRHPKLDHYQTRSSKFVITCAGRGCSGTPAAQTGPLPAWKQNLPPFVYRNVLGIYERVVRRLERTEWKETLVVYSGNSGDRPRSSSSEPRARFLIKITQSASKLGRCRFLHPSGRSVCNFIQFKFRFRDVIEE